MSTTKTYSRDYFVIVQTSPNPNTYNNHSLTLFQSRSKTAPQVLAAAVAFAKPEDSVKDKAILSASLTVSAFTLLDDLSKTWGAIDCSYLEGTFTENDTFTDLPTSTLFNDGVFPNYSASVDVSPEQAWYLMHYGVFLEDGHPSSVVYNNYIYTTPQLKVTFSDDTATFTLVEDSTVMLPQAGIVLQVNAPIKFKSSISFSQFAYERPAFLTNKVKIRLKGTETWEEYGLDGKGQISIEGNLLPIGTVEYCYEASIEGQTFTSSIYEITTTNNPFRSTTPESGTIFAGYSKYFIGFLNDGYTASTFRYRKAGATDYTEITELETGTTGTVRWAQYWLKHEGLESAEYEYQFTGTNGYGVVSTSEWIPFTTDDPVPGKPTAVKPKSEMVEYAKPAAFQWYYRTESYLPQSKADIEISYDNVTWEALATAVGNVQTVNATLPEKAGIVYWKVKTYNSDGDASEWSEAISFQAIGAPPTPIISATDFDLRPTILWQAADQVAAEIKFGGETYAIWGASTKTWKCPYYMKAISTTVYVRVQNNLGLWSDWASLDIIVDGKIGTISLTGKNDNGAAKLEWDISDNDFFLVYRNGEPIAKTVETEYTDYFSAGNTSYYIIGGNYDNDDYSISKEITVNVIPKSEILIDVDALKTISLEITDEQDRRTQLTQNITSATYTLSGKIKPTVETNGALTKTVSLTAAFENADDEKTLLECIGKTVCLKTTKGRMAIGVLTALPIYDEQFYSVYTISVTDSDFPEVIDIDTGMPI